MSEDTGRLVGGRYRLGGVLGRGGMGTVWRGEDEVLGRRVAVKELRFPSSVDEEEKQRLITRTLREAKAIARIRSGSAITVFDVVNEDSRPWIVMELVEGRSLADQIKKDGPLEPQRAAQVGLAILDVLRAAHREGILHRDVKPSNVLLEDGTGRVVLTDFGIAKVEGDPSVTSTGMLVGAPSYISPERARGKPPGPPADLWSLGGLLYAAVEGRPPYDKGSAISTLTAVMTEPVPFPEHAGELHEVIAGLLVKDPEKRLDVSGARLLLEPVASGLKSPLGPSGRDGGDPGRTSVLPRVEAPSASSPSSSPASSSGKGGARSGPAYSAGTTGGRRKRRSEGTSSGERLRGAFKSVRNAAGAVGAGAAGAGAAGTGRGTDSGPRGTDSGPGSRPGAGSPPGSGSPSSGSGHEAGSGHGAGSGGPQQGAGSGSAYADGQRGAAASSGAPAASSPSVPPVPSSPPSAPRTPPRPSSPPTTSSTTPRTGPRTEKPASGTSTGGETTGGKGAGGATDSRDGGAASRPSSGRTTGNGTGASGASGASSRGSGREKTGQPSGASSGSGAASGPGSATKGKDAKGKDQDKGAKDGDGKAGGGAGAASAPGSSAASTSTAASGSATGSTSGAGEGAGAGESAGSRLPGAATGAGPLPAAGSGGRALPPESGGSGAITSLRDLRDLPELRKGLPPRTLALVAGAVVVVIVVIVVLVVSLSSGGDGKGDDASGKGSATAGAEKAGSSGSREGQDAGAAKDGGRSDGAQDGKGDEGDEGDKDGGEDEASGSGLPDGYGQVKDGRFHFSVAMPDGWKRYGIAGSNSGGKYAADSGGYPRIQIDRTSSPGADAAKAWRQQESAATSKSPGYKSLGIEAVEWRDYPTVADWQFLREEDGKKVHVLNRGFKVDDENGYAILITCEADAWQDEECETLRDTAFETFKPL
ncbi:serine/threonine protein kinase [Streptomyces tubbatahanensis]|uniref:non-specific serine/threonine protein kinase n=1 Tax=Streptomyces tubbatahanensis TaxID=2923272 RepID=A0ABY3XW61_9ACTN|nr:serine/threonine-protein kinase [Streptomyces tubbatahanensis]UNS98498.1 serine/threonine protein kinase [Streptomyces tubbatahanensis]